ncbi:MAG: chaperone modulator CbpM [Desulfobulbus sp.]|nr:chaperone modulator CbpM [Desulfobulbus sp.]
MKEPITCITGIVFNEETRCSLADLCRLCNVSAELIETMIDEGIVTPEGPSPREWQFTFVAIKRVQTVIRLQQDLRVNLPGCALALDLLDEIEALRQRTRRR